MLKMPNERIAMPYIKSFFRIVFHSPSKLSLKSVRKERLPYIWSWIAIFIWLYSYFLPMGDFAFENALFESTMGDSPVYFYFFLISGCLIPLIFDGKKFVSAAFYSVIVSLICFVSVLLIGPGTVSKVIMLIAVPCIAHIFVSNVYAFFMALNNSEKFYSMILAVLLPKVLLYVKPIFFRTESGLNLSVILIFLTMVTLSVCHYLIKRNIGTVVFCQKVKAPIKAYSLMPVVFVAFALNDIIAPAALQNMSGLADIPVESHYFFGILAGLAVVLLLQNRFSMNLCNMLNLSFAFLAVGFVTDIVRMQYPDMVLVSAVCFGVAYSIGIVNIYYLAGFMIKKFRSVSFYRTGILLSTLCYFVPSIFVHVFGQRELLVPSPIWMAFISVCIVILFFILSPFFVKMLYSGEWIDDAYREDVTQGSRLEAKLKDYRLTPSEAEVCRLLLEGYTLRQISGMQAKAYATINTYCTSIYRKLNINSRAELLLLLQEYKK